VRRVALCARVKFRFRTEKKKPANKGKTRRRGDGLLDLVRVPIQIPVKGAPVLGPSPSSMFVFYVLYILL
jgi:hypothetical protein